jgi:hypothetical protein
MAGAGIQQTTGFRAKIHKNPPLVRISPLNGGFLGWVQLYANTLSLRRKSVVALEVEEWKSRIFGKT